MPKPRLVQLSYSPWSERARWAMDHHGIAYDTVEHTPFLGELRLRRIVGRASGRATVPVLIVAGRVLTSSWDIAAYADGYGHGAKLIPASQEAGVREWAQLADETCSLGRTLVVSSLLASDAALDESLPFPLPPFLIPTMRPITRYALQWFARKWQISPERVAEHEERMGPALERMSRAVKASPYLLGAFTYADIAVATVLQGISPVGNAYIRLGPSTRRAWTRPALEKNYPELLRWRDNLYAQHRSRRTTDELPDGGSSNSR